MAILTIATDPSIVFGYPFRIRLLVTKMASELGDDFVAEVQG